MPTLLSYDRLRARIILINLSKIDLNAAQIRSNILNSTRLKPNYLYLK